MNRGTLPQGSMALSEAVDGSIGKINAGIWDGGQNLIDNAGRGVGRWAELRAIA
jgi:hypothetical protein